MATRRASLKAASPKRRVARDGTLREYNARRDFSLTAEPEGIKALKDGHRFVVQKHDATRLHYDLRLELDGVLKSWAVTRGPSLVPADKRLAVQTEDHPIKYIDFEGVIPKGEYGGGTMIVWDEGVWQPDGDAQKGLKKGHLHFTLAGQRLKGGFHLVRLRGKPREKRTNWLLIKSDDEFARAEKDTPITEIEDTSILTKRTNADLERAGVLAPAARPTARATTAPKPAAAPKKASLGRKAALPDFVEPQLATLVEEAPDTSGWLHEIKYDGYRIQARIQGAKVQLLTRKGLDWAVRFSPVAKALKALKLPNALLDGEIVVEDENGRSDFSSLQQSLKAGDAGKFLYRVFDLLHVDGRDLRNAPLSDRKQALQDLLANAPADGIVRFSEHIENDGAAMIRHVCRLGLEGVVSKKMDGRYRSGRGTDWVKTKCTARQELVIAGYVPSTVASNAVGSLVMGVYEKDKLVHVGRSGTGFTADLARGLMKQLRAIQQDQSPFAAKLTGPAAKGVRWVKPELVAEVEMHGFTHDGLIRHAAFKGLREDKDAMDIVRETPKGRKAPKAAKAAAPPPQDYDLTHPDRVYWPDIGLTKLGLAEYYDSVADHILPHIVGRPLSLVRCPSGATAQCFYQKHGWDGMPKEIRTRTIKGEEMVYIEDRDGLIALVQSGVLEIHPWGAMLKTVEKPDRIILDFDPGPGVDWQAVMDGAVEARQRLKDMGLVSFLKTSGGKGLHVVVPLTPKADWDTVKDFSHAVADAMAKDSPDRYLSNMSKKLRPGKIFVDYLRNGRGNTAVAPFSTRARPGAAVSTPIAWSELGPDMTPTRFTAENIAARLKNLKKDPWADFFKIQQALPAAGRRRRAVKS